VVHRGHTLDKLGYDDKCALWPGGLFPEGIEKGGIIIGGYRGDNRSQAEARRAVVQVSDVEAEKVGKIAATHLKGTDDNETGGEGVRCVGLQCGVHASSKASVDLLQGGDLIVGSAGAGDESEGAAGDGMRVGHEAREASAQRGRVHKGRVGEGSAPNVGGYREGKLRWEEREGVPDGARGEGNRAQKTMHLE
jgi:hypothetical protein